MKEKNKRFGHPEPKLIIWLEAEQIVKGKRSGSSPRGEALAYWHLRRLSLNTQEVAFDYDVNAPKYFPREQTHVICGKGICKKLTGETFDKHKYIKLLGREIWICHSFEYMLVNAGDNYEANRLLYLAAQSCGLSPLVDLTVEMYQHFAVKLR